MRFADSLVPRPVGTITVLTIAVLTIAVIASFGCSSPEDLESAIDARNAVPAPLVNVDDPFELAGSVELAPTEVEDHEFLHNVYRLGDSIISGSEPHGEEAFARLEEMGVRTILSVDGKIPDQELAERHGIRYVHVPIQYKGITDDEIGKIAKTFRELEGPFFVHCFHGKHRGPAAAAVGRLILDGISREEALAEMRRCGTSSKYDGLYETVASADIPGVAATTGLEYDFAPAHRVGGFRDAMIRMTRIFDQIKYLERRGWEPDADHPDIDPINESQKLAELFRQANALDDMSGRPHDFREWMDESVVASAELHESIRALRAGSGSVEPVADAYGRVRSLCSDCHSAYRND